MTALAAQLEALINVYVEVAGLDAAKTLCIDTLARHAAAEPEHVLPPHSDAHVFGCPGCDSRLAQPFDLTDPACAVCGADGCVADLDPVFDSHAAGGVKHVCRDLHACYERARKATVNA